MLKKLSEMEPGKFVRINSFIKNDIFLKLMEMGCLPGEIISIEKIAPLGDPISIKVSGYFLSRGWPLYKARRTALLIFAVCAFPMLAAQRLGTFNYWYAVIIIGLAASAHQAWSANIFTTVSDMFPKKAVASVVGIGGMIGAIGGIIIARTAGLLLDHYKLLGKIETGYYVLFIICALAYIVAWILFSLLVPKMPKVNL